MKTNELVNIINKHVGYAEQEIYDALNQYLKIVITTTLETAAESKCTYVKVDLDGRKTHPTGLCKQSITNTFEETYKKFEV